MGGGSRVAVVTGGASGIGEGIVRRHVAAGGRCVVADLRIERAEALAAELGDSVVARRVDVTREADVAAAVDLAVSHFGRLDAMFNNDRFVAGRYEDELVRREPLFPLWPEG